MRKLKIALSDLEEAFTADPSSGMNYHLDPEAGKLLISTDDAESAVDEFFEEAGAKESDPDLDQKFEKWLENCAGADWQIDWIRDAFRIRCDTTNRLILIPQRESQHEYQDMVDFAEAVSDDHLQELLLVALKGKGAFRRFKDVLLEFPEQRQRFFEFNNQRLRDRILAWLAEEGLELEMPRKEP